MKRRTVETAVAVLLLLTLYYTAHSVEELSQKRYKLEVMYLPSSRFVQEIALGYRNLAADILWFRTIQYYGSYRMGENDLALFNHLVDVITDLDPQFTFAYLFGALIIAEDLGYFSEGIRFLEKGIQHNPDDWWLVFEMGFLYYVDARDYAAAVRYFRRASRMPGTGEIAGRFAAFVAAKAGHTETSIAMWKELARTSENQHIRDLAERYIEKLEAGLEAGDPHGESSPGGKQAEPVHHPNRAPAER
jgi:tetratricopeptide (TPR) repeat protein